MSWNIKCSCFCLYAIIVILSTLIGLCGAFQCTSCSYSYSKDDPDQDTACIHLPEVYTGWQILKCADYCVVQEIYNVELKKVVAYWRSCSDKPDSGFCRGDRLMTCLHTCRGDKCNSWVRGQLHTIYAGKSDPNNGSGSFISWRIWNINTVITVSACIILFIVNY